MFMTDKQLNSLGEFGFIRRIQQRAGSAVHLLQGIGDDCAVQHQQSGQQLLTSTDLLIEGVHFDRRWTSMEHLGRKAAAVNLSDIAAMGGTPQSLFLAVGCPEEVSLSDLEQLLDGFLAEIAAYGAILAGGDSCRSPGPLFLSVTVQGVVEAGAAVFRHGARPGDSIYVSGTLGDSALALQLLLEEQKPSAELLARHHRPQARIELGQQLGKLRLASAMLDISDGLLGDLEHILEASSVGAELDLTALPLSSSFSSRLATDPQLLDLALAGGEDYELLFTSPQPGLAEDRRLSTPVTRIGTVRTGSGVRILQADGALYQCQRGGFDHFIRAAD
jgi:thiamine-monophosphate kinase